MDAEDVRRILKVGATLAILGNVLAIVAFVFNVADTLIGLALGLFAPLFGFYFIGAYLSLSPRFGVLGEELLRGIIWYFGSLIAWSLLVNASSNIPASPLTVLGFPAVTAVLIVGLFVGIRHGTGHDLRVQSEGVRLFVIVTTGILGGFLVLYVVLARGRSLLLLPVYLVVAVGTTLVWWHINPSSGQSS